MLLCIAATKSNLLGQTLNDLELGSGAARSGGFRNGFCYFIIIPVDLDAIVIVL